MELVSILCTLVPVLLDISTYQLSQITFHALRRSTQRATKQPQKSFTIISFYTLDSRAASYTIRERDLRMLYTRVDQSYAILKIEDNPYHQQGNIECKRVNQTFLNMLKTFKEDHKSSWKDYVNKSVHAYNCSKKSTTGYSLFFLLFGIKPVPPIDLLLPDTVNQKQDNLCEKFQTLDGGGIQSCCR